MFYKGNSKNPLLFEIVFRLHQVQMKGDLILHIRNILRTQMLEAVIDGLSRGNNLIGMMRGINPPKFLPLGKEDMEVSDKLELWLRCWWGDTLIAMETPDWFEEEKNGDNLLWYPSSSTMKTS